jgi:hypothetical protein
MQTTEYRCVGGCVGGWENDSLVLTLDRQKKTTLSGTSRYIGTADDARPYEGLKTAMHGPMKAWFAAIFFYFFSENGCPAPVYV